MGSRVKADSCGCMQMLSIRSTQLSRTRLPSATGMAPSQDAPVLSTIAPGSMARRVSGSLNGSTSNSRAFWVGGGGIDWAWTGNWTVKMEYLFLGLEQTETVCVSSNCANNRFGGVHSTKIGVNYKIY